MSTSSVKAIYEALRSLPPHRPGQGLSASDIDNMNRLLDRVSVQDLGLADVFTALSSDQGTTSTGQGFNLTERKGKVTYMHMADNANFCIGIFVFTEGCTMPFHDHPDMTVFTKVIHGEMFISAYDWLPGTGPSISENTSQPAVRVVHQLFKAGDPAAVLRPSAGGNVHQLQARTDCAILDILVPPYEKEAGEGETFVGQRERLCTFYELDPEYIDDGQQRLRVSVADLPYTLQKAAYTGSPLESLGMIDPSVH